MNRPRHRRTLMSNPGRDFRNAGIGGIQRGFGYFWMTVVPEIEPRHPKPTNSGRYERIFHYYRII